MIKVTNKIVDIKYKSSITRKGITRIKGKIKRIKGFILFRYNFSFSCLNGKVVFKNLSTGWRIKKFIYNFKKVILYIFHTLLEYSNILIFY